MIAVFLFSIMIQVTFFSVVEAYAIQESPRPIVELSENETVTPDDGREKDYFTIDSTPDDVRRLQGEPDDMFDDGRRKVWYYGKDAVYFNYYGKVMDVDNNSGKLKFQ